MQQSTITTQQKLENLILEVENFENFFRKDKETNNQPNSTKLIRDNLRKKYLEILKIDINIVTKKDVIQNMWRYCFYSQISIYRKQIKKESSDIYIDKYHDVLKECKLFYTQFLEEYLLKARLFKRNNSYYDIIEEFKFAENIRKPYKKIEVALIICQKILIFLGDIERYFQLTLKENTRDFSHAALYYQQALQLIPTNGNPHNQLAILASYISNPISTIYQYFRSLHVRDTPFIGAKTNIKKQFINNKKKFLDKYSNSPYNDIHMFILSINDVEIFYSALIYLFSILYDNEKEYKNEVEDVNKFCDLSTDILTIFKTLLFDLIKRKQNDKGFLSNLILEILTISICIFDESFHSSSSTSTNVLMNYIWILYFMREVFKTIQVNSLNLLGVATIFCEYFSLNQSIFFELKLFSPVQKTYSTNCLSAFFSSFLNMFNRCSAIKSLYSKSHINQFEHPPLPEYHELRGFLPLAEHITKHPDLIYFIDTRKQLSNKTTKNCKTTISSNQIPDLGEKKYNLTHNCIRYKKLKEFKNHIAKEYNKIKNPINNNEIYKKNNFKKYDNLMGDKGIMIKKIYEKSYNNNDYEVKNEEHDYLTG